MPPSDYPASGPPPPVETLQSASEELLAVRRKLRLAEERLRESDARLRILSDSMGEGFVITEAIIDSQGRVEDYRILECNPAFSGRRDWSARPGGRWRI